VVTALVMLLALGASLRMKGAQLPLKYPVRIVAIIQLITVAYFWLSPTAFPYSIGRHSEELMTIGYVVMLATPVMLGMGYYILRQNLAVKLVHTVLILGFFMVMVPHQVLAQAFIMQHLSVLFMPVLYICFGAVFDALVFVALYSWAVSNAPLDATT
jgi:small-conductance mechanosensitive channel